VAASQDQPDLVVTLETVCFVNQAHPNLRLVRQSVTNARLGLMLRWLDYSPAYSAREAPILRQRVTFCPRPAGIALTIRTPRQDLHIEIAVFAYQDTVLRWTGGVKLVHQEPQNPAAEQQTVQSVRQVRLLILACRLVMSDIRIVLCVQLVHSPLIKGRRVQLYAESAPRIRSLQKAPWRVRVIRAMRGYLLPCYSQIIFVLPAEVDFIKK
jgi:hypothetical protein